MTHVDMRHATNENIPEADVLSERTPLFSFCAECGFDHWNGHEHAETKGWPDYQVMLSKFGSKSK